MLATLFLSVFFLQIFAPSSWHFLFFFFISFHFLPLFLCIGVLASTEGVMGIRGREEIEMVRGEKEERGKCHSEH